MSDRASGLARAEQDWTIRYEYDARGRILSALGDVKRPRFVWARAAEGTIWRFAADLAEDTVSAVARLAGRESGFGLAQSGAPAPPERLEMIRRRIEADAAALSSGASGVVAERELIWEDGAGLESGEDAPPRLRAEIWTLG